MDITAQVCSLQVAHVATNLTQLVARDCSALLLNGMGGFPALQTADFSFCSALVPTSLVRHLLVPDSDSRLAACSLEKGVACINRSHRARVSFKILNPEAFIVQKASSLGTVALFLWAAKRGVCRYNSADCSITGLGLIRLMDGAWHMQL